MGASSGSGTSGKNGSSNSNSNTNTGSSTGSSTATQTAMYAAMMQYMAALSAQQMATQEAMQQAMLAQGYASLPSIQTNAKVDWSETHDKLKSMASAEYGTSEAARKGSLDTVLTSPLLDEESANVIGGANLGT